MKYFQPINMGNKTIYFNAKTFEQTADNLAMMLRGYAPIGVDGKKVTLHHITQTHDSNLATLTHTFHCKHDKVIHGILPPNKNERVNRERFDLERKDIWRAIAKWITN
jgi:hypothetical protein